MIPVVCIAGWSESGKTTFLERLLPELKGRGLRVIAVKHTHEDADCDVPGKDSWRLARAGSDAVVLHAGKRLMINTLLPGPLGLDGVLSHVVGDFDLAVVEGFHDAGYPKIEVHRRGSNQPIRSAGADLLGMVTDEPLDVDVPQFTSDDVAGVADLITRKLLNRRRRQPAQETASIGG